MIDTLITLLHIVYASAIDSTLLRKGLERHDFGVCNLSKLSLKD